MVCEQDVEGLSMVCPLLLQRISRFQSFDPATVCTTYARTWELRHSVLVRYKCTSEKATPYILHGLAMTV